MAALSRSTCPLPPPPLPAEGERTMMMQMAQMVAGMTPEQRAAMAAQTGMPLAQLNQVRAPP